MPSARGVWENVIAGLVVLALVAVVTWIASMFDSPIPLWVAMLAIALALLLGVGVGVLLRSGEDLPGYQADLMAEAILGLREVVADDLDVSFDEFIERGVLEPARFGISVVSGEEIRLSVLRLDPASDSFRMLYEAGHTLGRKGNFSLPRDSMAGRAFDSGDLQWTNNVEDDHRWKAHPLAREERRYYSLASMPIEVGGEVVAVLNVVSTEKGAFLTGDLTYVELLGGFIGLAWALNSAEQPHRLDSSEETTASERKGI